MPHDTVQLRHAGFILIPRHVEIEPKRSEEDALHGVDALDGDRSFTR